MKRRLVLSASLASIAVPLAGCATRANIEDGTVVSKEQGLLAFKCDSNIDALLSFVEYEADSTFGSRLAENLVGPKGSFSIKQGEAFFLRAVTAGEYMWSRVTVYPKVARLHSSNRFTVKPGRVTYIGHIRLFSTQERVQLRAFDRESDFRAYFEATYPAYAKSMQVEKAIAEFRM